MAESKETTSVILPRLIVPTSGGGSKERRLEGQTVVGRHSSCEIVIVDESVSRRHAMLRPDPNGLWTLLDLGSANGTCLDGASIGLPVMLKNGDRIRFGEVETTFLGPDPTGQAFFNNARVSTAHSTTIPGTQSGLRPALVGVSPAMLEVFGLARQAALSDIPVHIAGETGTGKELLARAIHQESSRADRPFVPINCAALPEPLLESSLFGHTKGSFTGASDARVGLLEAADGGSVLLDEIGEMSPAMQAKLLRFLQDGEVLRVGDKGPTHIDVRILSATNRVLSKDSNERFRRDVYYRLSAFTIALPPLRERTGDIPLLTERLLHQACERHEKHATLDHNIMPALEQYNWPGNVRELENELLRCVAMVQDGGRITRRNLSPQILENRQTKRAPEQAAESDDRDPDLRAAVGEFERRHIAAALEANRGNVSRTAQELGLSRSALYKKLTEFGLNRGTDY